MKNNTNANVSMSQEQLSDHNLLIALNTKVDYFLDDFKVYNASITAKMQDFEHDMEEVKTVLKEYNIPQLAKDVKDAKQFINDLQKGWKWSMSIVYFILGVIGVILSRTVIPWDRLFTK